MEFSGSDLGVVAGFAVVFIIVAIVLIHDNRPGPRNPDEVHKNAANMLPSFRQQGLKSRRSTLHDELD